MTAQLPSTRSELLGLLSEACEIEHALACVYLYAAFSVKTGLDEGLSWQEQQHNVRDASEVYKVAAEEMFHLAQAWNLLTAIGGSPWLERPPFPRPRRAAPLHRALVLERWSKATLLSFHGFETPESPPEVPAFKRPRDVRGHFDYQTVGELYELIADGIKALPEQELFIGSGDAQADRALADFHELVPVRNRADALEAIGRIRRQGEGRYESDPDSHFNTFERLLERLQATPDPERLVREVASTPLRYVDDGVPTGATLITHPRTLRLASLFDDIYLLMLQLLGFSFAQSTAPPALRRTFAQRSIQLMARCIRPLGAALTREPIAEDGGSLRAGACFQLGRVVHLPSEPRVARRLVRERFARLAEAARRLDSITHGGDRPLLRIAEHLASLGELGAEA